MKLNELRNLSKEDLTVKLASFKEQLGKLYYLKSVGQVDKPHQFKELKKTISRIHTLLREMETNKSNKEQG